MQWHKCIFMWNFYAYCFVVKESYIGTIAILLGSLWRLITSGVVIIYLYDLVGFLGCKFTDYFGFHYISGALFCFNYISLLLFIYSMLFCRGLWNDCTEYVYTDLVSGNFCSRTSSCCQWGTLFMYFNKVAFDKKSSYITDSC